MAELVDRETGRHDHATAAPGVTEDLAAARREELTRRPEHLRAAVSALQSALADPAGDERAQRERLATALATAHEHVAAHNEEAEGPDGLLSQVLHDAAWLSPRVHAVAQEHDRLLVDCERLCSPGGDADAIDELEQAARTMATRIEEHRHHGTELLMDAYGLDVSAGD
jgi:hypothetical protein